MPLIRSDFFCALTRWDFFRVFFCRINFSALSCGGFLGAVSGTGFLSALFSSGLVHVVFRIAFSVRSIGAALYLSRFVCAFFCALFQRYFFRALFREALLPRTFCRRDFHWLFPGASFVPSFAWTVSMDFLASFFFMPSFAA